MCIQCKTAITMLNCKPPNHAFAHKLLFSNYLISSINRSVLLECAKSKLTKYGSHFTTNNKYNNLISMVRASSFHDSLVNVYICIVKCVGIR